jgi:hypothetical protein
MKCVEKCYQDVKNRGNRVRWAGYMGGMGVERMRAEELGG